MRDLGRVALVTGASRGLGAGMARALADAGHAVAVGYAHKQAAAESVAAALRRDGAEARAVEIRVEDRTSIRRAVATVREALGPVDVLVNNAGIAQEKPFAEISDADWDRMLAVNLRGPFACAQEVLPDMLERGFGRIINVASIGGQWGGLNQVHYACAKSGLIGLTRSLAKVYSGRGVTSNAVSPGLVATDMSSAELASEAGREKVRAIPRGRLGRVEEVAHAVVYLASDTADYVTGQTLNLNGGMYFG